LDAKGLIYKDTYAGWYSVSDECFYTDAQITRITDPITFSETVVATESGSVVSYTSEETYKFRLSAFRARLLDHFLSNPAAIQPKPYYDQIIGQLSKQDVEFEDLSISRPRSRLEWGVSVPGDNEQTIYVWIDALTVYLTGAGYPWTSDEGGKKGGWPVDLQIIGKDILRYAATLNLGYEDFLTNAVYAVSTPSTFQRCSSLSLYRYRKSF
jgi:methionyl-tRNA synthetase